MIKVNKKEILVGTEFQIRNSWRAKIAKALGVEEGTYPFEFKITNNNNCTYICESIPENKKDTVQHIVANEYVLKYLFGEEVDDDNVGLYLTDYIPLEGTKLMMDTNSADGRLLAVSLDLNIEVISKDTVSLEYKLNDLLIDKSYSLKTHLKDSWKAIFGSDKYTTIAERVYQDTFTHKSWVERVGARFEEYLRNNGCEADADALHALIRVHDNSKILNKDEFKALTRVVDNKTTLKDANKVLSEYQKDAIELHRNNNEHHWPVTKKKVERPVRMETAVDWCARSLQFGTDLIEYAKTAQENTFHMDEILFDEMIQYCKILVEITKDMQHKAA